MTPENQPDALSLIAGFSGPNAVAASQRQQARSELESLRAEVASIRQQPIQPRGWWDVVQHWKSEKEAVK